MKIILPRPHEQTAGYALLTVMSIVAVSLEETETVKPVDAAATVSPGEGAVASKALSGLTATAKGFKNTYADQLLFHVPAAGSSDKIVLLGFAQGLISSTELP